MSNYEGRFEMAQKCINDIDDYLEYAYMAHSTPRSLRDRVMSFIDNYGEEIADTGPRTAKEWADSRDCH